MKFVWNLDLAGGSVRPQQPRDQPELVDVGPWLSLATVAVRWEFRGRRGQRDRSGRW